MHGKKVQKKHQKCQCLALRCTEIQWTSDWLKKIHSNCNSRFSNPSLENIIIKSLCTELYKTQNAKTMRFWLLTHLFQTSHPRFVTLAMIPHVSYSHIDVFTFKRSADDWQKPNNKKERDLGQTCEDFRYCRRLISYYHIDIHTDDAGLPQSASSSNPYT